MTSADLQSWILERLAQQLDISAEEIDPDLPFSSYGVDSAIAAGMSGELEALLERRLDPVLLFEHPTVRELVEHLTAERPGSTMPARSQAQGPAVAVVGMACRFPGAGDLASYWALLRDGGNAISEVPEGRWSIDELYDAEPLKPGKVSTRWGGFIDGVEDFDRRFFGVTAAEAESMDPQQRILLELFLEALTDAGIVPSTLGRTGAGVFVGISQSEYGAMQARSRAEIGGYTGTGSALSITANRVSYFLNLRGPSMAIDTACSSSLVAVHQAIRSVRSGECEVALVGGANLLLTPEPTIALSKAGMMAADGSCKPFDDRADGYVRGEGVGVIVLKALDAATRDGDRIHAVLRGSAVQQDGRSNGLTAPNPAAQEELLRKACCDAGVEPADVRMVEAHGTGTRLGDPIEAAALGRVFGSSRPIDEPLLIGSVKSNIGHLEAAAGIAGLIKAILSLEHGEVPGTPTFVEPNALIEFERQRLRVVTEPVALKHDGRPWLAGVSSFGFGGTIGHVVLESAPAAPRRERPLVASVVPLAAPDASSLAGLAARYAATIKNTTGSLADISYTAAVRRPHDGVRAAVTGTTVAEFVAELDVIARQPTSLGATGGPPAVAFVFSGQGSQWAGMGLETMRTCQDFADTIAAHDRWAREQLGVSIVDELELVGDASRLTQTSIAQLTIVSLQIALVELLERWGITPEAVVGHSVGEISAAYAAGALTAEQALQLAWRRGCAMDTAQGAGAMLAVQRSAEDLTGLLAEIGSSLEIAAINGPAAVVVSGDKKALERLAAHLEERGEVPQWLRVEHPFHSGYMEVPAQHLREELAEWHCAPVGARMYSTVLGTALGATPLDAEYWARNVRSTVRFSDALGALLDDGADILLEVGSHPVLRTVMREVADSRGARAVEITSTLDRRTPSPLALGKCLAALYVAGANIDFGKVFAEGGELQPLPLFPWRHESFWLRAQPKEPSQQPRTGESLLGGRLPLAESLPTSAWTASISAEAPAFLADHVVGGFPLLPATAYAALGLAAFESERAEPGAVEELVIEAALPLQGEVELQTWLAREASGESNVRVYARAAGAAEFTRHAHMRVVPASDLELEEEVESLAAIQCRCLEQFPVDAFYDSFRELGLDYGPSFRGIKDVWRRDGESLATLRPAQSDAALPDSRVHPARLDAALHAVAAAIPGVRPEAPGELLLPVGLEGVQLASTLDDTVKVHATVRSPGDAQEVVADVRLLRADGSCHGTVDGLRLVPVRSKTSRAHEANETQAIWLYRQAWEERESDPVEPRPGRWLVVRDPHAEGDLCAVLRERGHDVTEVMVGSRYSRESTERYEVDAADSETFAALARDALSSTDAAFENVIYQVGLGASPSPAASGEAHQRAALDGCMPLLHLTRALALHLVVTPPRLWVLTQGAHRCRASDVVRPVQGALWGLTKGIGLEQPDLKACCVDLAAIPKRGDRDLDALVQLLESDAAEAEVAVRDGQRHVARIVPDEVVEDFQPLELRPDATYVVSGGLGALGSLVGAWLSACGARHIALLSRREPSPEVCERLSAMKQHGVDVRAFAVDVANDRALDTTMEAIREQMPPVRGLVHAAGVLDDGAAIGLCRNRMATVLAPKVSGAINLREHTRGDDLDFFVLFSSAAATLGSVGQGSYIAANSFLDAFAEDLRRVGVPAVSIAWGAWAGAGMAADAATGTGSGNRISGISMILPEDGLAVMEAVMASDRSNVAVLPFDIRSLVHLYPGAAGISRFERLFGDDLHARRNVSVSAPVAQRPQLEQEYLAPENELQASIAAIWQRALEIDSVGVQDAFFELGGDSVLAGQVLTQINTTLGVTLDSRRAFEQFTVQALSELAEDAMRSVLETMSEKETLALLGGAR